MKKSTLYYIEQFHKHNAFKGLEPATQESYRNMLRIFNRYLEKRKKTRINQIDKKLVENYTMTLLEQELSRHSINSYLRAVRRFLNYLRSEGVIRAVEVKLIAAHEVLKPVLEASEQGQIFSAHQDDQSFAISALLFGTGIRTNSLINIVVSDINFDEKNLAVQTNKNKRCKIIPLTDFVIEVLKSHILKKSLHSNDLLFSNTHGRKYTRRTLWGALKRYFIKCNVNKTGVHIFRRSFAKGMVQNGSDSITLMNWLNHSTVVQSEKYVKLYSDDLRLTMNQYNPTAKMDFGQRNS